MVFNLLVFQKILLQSRLPLADVSLLAIGLPGAPDTGEKAILFASTFLAAKFCIKQCGIKRHTADEIAGM